MRGRLLTAAPAVLAGVLFASVASAAVPAATMVAAAPWQVASASNGELGEIVPLNVALGGGVTVLAVDRSAYVGFPESISDNNSGSGLKLAQGPNWVPFDSLFASGDEMSSGYISGSRSFGSDSFALTNSISFEFSHSNLDFGAFDASASGSATRDFARRLGGIELIGTTSASLNWSFAQWGSLGLAASRSRGDGALLGPVATSASTAGGLADSAALGVSARVGFGEGWVTTVAYSEGVTQLDLNQNNLIGELNPVRSQAYALGVAKEGLFGDDALGIAVSRTLQIYNSNSFGAIDSGLAMSSGQARESDVALGYVTTFLDGTIALQANAAYQMNAAGAKGQNAVTGVARAKLNF